jgi:hypothetical protein
MWRMPSATAAIMTAPSQRNHRRRDFVWLLIGCIDDV